MKKKLKLGVFGFGCVGQGLYHVLQETQGIKAEIKKICIKNPGKQRIIDPQFFTTQKEEIINDPEIDVVVELIDDADVAFDVLKASLKNGKAVVTANKKMLAEHLEEIYNLQQRYQRPVLYEGAVCASIPIIRNLEEYYDNDLLTSVEGIFNGSTNYILTKIFEETKSYTQALQDAQALGFAESDPSLDVLGFDPKFKLAITITHAFGVFVRPSEIINFGIDKISDVDIKYAKENGYTIKLVARAYKIDGKIYGLVAPQFVDLKHLLANIRNEYNAVVLEGAFSEKQVFSGKGAGSYPTGSAVLSDISALVHNYGYEYKKLNQGLNHEFSNHAGIEAQVSFIDQKKVSAVDFEQLSGGYQSAGKYFMNGLIRLERIRELASMEDVSVILSADARLKPIRHKAKEELELV